jgi:hypothetical protein
MPKAYAAILSFLEQQKLMAPRSSK